MIPQLQSRFVLPPSHHQPDTAAQKKCFSKFSESRLDRLVADYKENHKSPCNFVLQHCSLENFKTSENQRFVFSFTNDLGRRCSVCRTFLLKIFGIGVSTVQRARNLFKKQILAASDNRGKHSNRVNRITEEAKEEMDMHFKSLNAVPSHYTESNLLYIEQPNSDLLTKHQAYLEYLALAKKPMSETKWNELRIEKFPNYVFTKPKTDCCNDCQEFRQKIAISSTSEKKEIEKKLSEHQDAARLARAIQQYFSQLAKKSTLKTR